MGLLYLKAGGDLPLNWVSPRQPKPPADPNFAKMRFWLVAGIAVLVGLFLMGQMMIADEEGAINTLNDQIQDAEGKLKIAREHGKHLKAMQDWAQPHVAGRGVRVGRPHRPEAGPAGLARRGLGSRTDDKKPSKYVGQLKMQGKLLDSTNTSRRAAYDQLQHQFTREGYYAIDTTQSKFDDKKFTLVVKVIRLRPDRLPQPAGRSDDRQGKGPDQDQEQQELTGGDPL